MKTPLDTSDIPLSAPRVMHTTASTGQPSHFHVTTLNGQFHIPTISILASTHWKCPIGPPSEQVTEMKEQLTSIISNIAGIKGESLTCQNYSV